MNFNMSTAQRIEAMRRTCIRIDQRDIMLCGVQNPKGMGERKGRRNKRKKNSGFFRARI